jgi:hypothetical protein
MLLDIKLNLPITNKYLVVGSYLLPFRQSKDIDVICYKDDIQVPTIGDDYLVSFIHNNTKVECLLADKCESLQFILKEYYYTSYDLLYAIKKGHIIYPSKDWDKHIHDLHILKTIIYSEKFQNVEHYNDTLPKLIKLHRKSTQERYNLTTPRLKGVSKEEFFDDYVTKYYEHDWLHTLVAHKDKPMYSYMQKDDTVECHKDLWNDNFTHINKIQCVLEESYVIAMERWLIPMLKGVTTNTLVRMTPRIAFKQALQKVCTTLCSGWFREFAIDNYFEIWRYYNDNYFDNVKHNFV